MSDTTLRIARFAGRSAVRGLAAELWLSASAMLRARATRRLLLEMDDRLLADIGVGRGEARAEAARPMWDLQPRRR